MVRARIEQYTWLLRCLNATVTGIRLIDPTQTELAHIKHHIKQAIAGTMKIWRELNILVTIKAHHILESYVYNQIVAFHGLGDKAEDFIK
jgi:hypothetical protein